MYEAIKNFNQQFLYEPEIINLENFSGKRSFVVVGMGGSALAAKLLKTWKMDLDITIHTDYGLPEFSIEELENMDDFRCTFIKIAFNKRWKK